MSWKNEVRKAFRKTNIIPEFGDGWVNFARPSGLNCEFYTCTDGETSAYLTASYTIDGKEEALDIAIPDDTERLVYLVRKILRK